MSRFVGLAIGFYVFVVGSAAIAQETPWFFNNSSSPVGAIIDMDGDGPDETDDCYFKVTGIPGTTGTFTLSLVDALGESCTDDFPCTGSFHLNPGSEATIDFEGCEEGGFGGFQMTFFRPGPDPTGSALLSPNTGVIPIGKGGTVGGLLCDANGPAALVDGIGMSFLFSLGFFPSAANPQFLVVPMLGQKLVGGSPKNVYLPLFNGKVTIASSSAPSTTAVEFDFGGLCDCSLGGQCPLTAPTAGVPAMNAYGLGAVALALLAIGAWAMRRRSGFALPLP